MGTKRQVSVNKTILINVVGSKVQAYAKRPQGDMGFYELNLWKTAMHHQYVKKGKQRGK